MAAFTVRRSLSLVALLLLLAVIILNFPTGAAAISSREYDAMQRVLRNRGYNLICNAMATSDLQYEILTLPPNSSFTIFAPTDASLFALDMIQTASSYTDTLRLHFVPLRLSLSDLRSISSGSILPTLLPYTALRLSTNPLAVAGVDVTLPGLFYSRRVAVHGLSGIVSPSSAFSYGHRPASPPTTGGGADEVTPLKTLSNRTDLSPSASEAMAPSTTDSHLAPGAGLYPAGAESPVTAGPPSPTASHIFSSPVTAGPPYPTANHEISPASDQTPSASPPPENSVAARARALLLEITGDDSDSDDGAEIPEKSELLTEAEAAGKVKKCGSLDEMTIDCFVDDEDGDGLEQLSLERLLRAMA